LKDIGVDSTLPHSLLLPTIETFTVQLPEDDGNVAVSKRPPREFMIRIRKAGQLLTREIINFLVDRPHDESTRFTGIPPNLFYLLFSLVFVLTMIWVAIQALDILCRHKSAMEFFNHKNSFFTSNLSQPVGNGAEVWYASSTIPSDVSGRDSINRFVLGSVLPLLFSC
jgi:hypothetical protein